LDRYSRHPKSQKHVVPATLCPKNAPDNHHLMQIYFDMFLVDPIGKLAHIFLADPIGKLAHYFWVSKDWFLQAIAMGGGDRWRLHCTPEWEYIPGSCLGLTVSADIRSKRQPLPNCGC
jgi:hypothetical protein